MEYKTGFLFTLNISQQDVIEHGLDVDLIEMAIYTLFKHIAISGVSSRLTKYGITYYQFTAKFVIEQLPIIGITTRQNIFKRMQKLIAAGLIEVYPDNKKEGVSFFTFGKMHYVLHDKAVNNTCNENEQPVTKKLHTCNEIVTPPVTKKLHNNNTIDKLHNNKEEREEQPKKTVAKKASIKPQQTEKDAPPQMFDDKSEMAGSSSFIWKERCKNDPELYAKLTKWAYYQILEGLPRVCKLYGKQYTDEQLQTWTNQQLIRETVNIQKTEFTMYGEPIECDTVKHMLNRANLQLRDKGGLDIATATVRQGRSKANNYQSPFK